MPNELWQWGVLAGVLLWDGLVLAVVWRMATPSWRRRPRVPKPIGGRVTYDRDEYGGIIEP